jgi:hypothetical protein
VHLTSVAPIYNRAIKRPGPKLRMSGVTPPVPHVTSWRAGQFYFTLEEDGFVMCFHSGSEETFKVFC